MDLRGKVKFLTGGEKLIYFLEKNDAFKPATRKLLLVIYD